MYIAPLPYITWGLIWDLKTKTKEILIIITEQRKDIPDKYQARESIFIAENIMADKQGPQAPPIAQGAQDPPAPQDPQPPQNPQIPPVHQAPHVPQALQVLQQPTQHMPPLNWSHFKPTFSRKPDEDAKAHLLRTNNWMDTYRFQDNDKVQRFCLTLTGDARLFYETLRLINVNWLGLQNTIRQQYSKINNTKEQLYHAWRSFYFERNVEAIDTYMHCIRQVTTLLGYQEPQTLDIFKISLPTKLYWVLFPIMDLQQAVETAKRILTKERIDRQLAGQTSLTPFMNIKEGYSKKVTFDMTDSIEQKIDKLTVIKGKLVTEDKGQNRQFKP